MLSQLSRRMSKLAYFTGIRTPNSQKLTFGQEASLPPLPVPRLEETLKRYLDSVKPLVKPEQVATQSFMRSR